MAVWSVVTGAAVAVKPAELAPAATVTDAGTVRFVLFDERVTAAPPEGAALFRVTVQLRLVQASEEIKTGAVRTIWLLAEEPLQGL